MAGTCEDGPDGDGGPAIAAELRTPSGVTVDATARVYIADSGSHPGRAVSDF
ncbi:MAG: hypothetical protein OXQ89_14130 [Rhodospirillaceae bacterium]|nr:hypothetical protein [Rhodospirillaceae bacterium]MDD9998875.1 hypothetical protein [Rhodospirillaceae bacterium]MDE0359884.1 hypothetical protein [Rhodospirillaceae bacterium]